jgi:DNA-binding transcriptional ArsR family regulator
MSKKEERLDAVFSALSDPSRRIMVARLAEGPARVGELAESLTISQPAVSQHIKVLRDAGLIEQRAEGPVRICSLREAQLQRAVEWIEGNRQIWNERFDALERELERTKGKSDE